VGTSSAKGLPMLTFELVCSGGCLARLLLLQVSLSADRPDMGFVWDSNTGCPDARPGCSQLLLSGMHDC
jgi:hypothetical protein